MRAPPKGCPQTHKSAKVTHDDTYDKRSVITSCVTYVSVMSAMCEYVLLLSAETNAEVTELETTRRDQHRQLPGLACKHEARQVVIESEPVPVQETANTISVEGGAPIFTF